MRAVIFANGEFDDPSQAVNVVHPDGLVIAADGGARHAWAAGLDPDVVIGDLDSLTEDERERLTAAGARIVAVPPRKDETDLELALLHAVRQGADEIVILGALGGRLDQTIANLLLLALPELREIDVRVVAGTQTAFLIRDEALIEGQSGATLSLIPLGGDAAGVTAEGVEWTLDEETLHFGPARGVSNVLTAERAFVRVRQGLLLCVVTHASK